MPLNPDRPDPRLDYNFGDLNQCMSGLGVRVNEPGFVNEIGTVVPF